MTKEAKANSRLSNNLLLIILVVLILLIIGLIIGIIVGNINKSNDGGSAGGDSNGAVIGAEPGGEFTEYRSEELQKLDQRAEEAEDTETAKGIYEEYINNTADSLARELAKSEYGRYLIDQGFLSQNQGLMDEGLRQLENVNTDGFNEEQQMAHFAGYRDYYEMIGDDESYNEYNDRIRDIITNSDMPKGGS